MIAFVILHYRALEMTRQCAETIRKLPGEKHLVIVDNASPNGTGKLLAEQYRDDHQVTVLLNTENAGFARGNNLGVGWVCEHLAADFTVVLNNDVEIPQEEFISRIGVIYREHPFDVLGPDILSVFSGIHQSPKSLQGCSLDSVRRKRENVKRSSNPVLLLLSSGEKNSPMLWRYVQRRRRARQNIDPAEAREGVVLHGACVIFSARYLKTHPEPFYPKTYMYYEMEILEWLCRREQSVVRYDPSLFVRHYQYVASRQEYRSIIRRSRFVMDCLLQSLTAAEELMLAADREAKA